MKRYEILIKRGGERVRRHTNILAESFDKACDRLRGHYPSEYADVEFELVSEKAPKWSQLPLMHATVEKDKGYSDDRARISREHGNSVRVFPRTVRAGGVSVSVYVVVARRKHA